MSITYEEEKWRNTAMAGWTEIARLGKITAQLRTENERLAYELGVIGDLAVVDWDDSVVGAVDKALELIPAVGRTYGGKTYAEVRRAELIYVEALREELERVKERCCMYNAMRKENLAMARRQLEENIRLRKETLVNL